MARTTPPSHPLAVQDICIAFAEGLAQGTKVVNCVLTGTVTFTHIERIGLGTDPFGKKDTIHYRSLLGRQLKIILRDILKKTRTPTPEGLAQQFDLRKIKIRD